MKSERGQAALGIVLVVAVFAIAFLLIGMAANQRGMQAGAEVMGESLGEAIDNVTAPELAASFWVNSQRNIVPNKHSIERHGADAWATTDCYNRNGTFAVYRVNNREFHLLCKDDDGSIRDLMLQRWLNNSKEFEVKNAFTPTPNNWTSIKAWLDGKRAELVMRGFKEIIIYVDGLIP
jgi:hypothetical protein